MTPQEFSDEFDVEYNNIMSDMAPGLDDYEKSKFLTQAQQELVVNLYSGSIGNGFESTELNRRYLANLISDYTQVTATQPYGSFGSFKKYTINLPSLLVIISEQAYIENDDCCSAEKMVNVYPVKYDELNITVSNPFRGPNSNRVLRADWKTNTLHIISKARMLKYTCEYLKKPSPIVVGNLGTLSVDGISTPQTSVLDDSLHRTIIKYAVQLAAASWASNNKS